MNKSMTLKPRLSEKAYNMSQENNVYVFEVPTNANKLSVAGAIEAQYGVSVTAVNISNTKGKSKLQYRKRGRKTSGKRPDIKKAYVSLKEGDTIVIFPAEDDKEKAKPEASKSKKATRSTK